MARTPRSARRPRVRYFADEDSEVGVTASALRRMGKARQAQYLKHWFGRYFEDPANETPYSSEEGGYQYVWGGPYDAQEQLANEFAGVVSDDVIERAARQLEESGTVDWAPTPNHPDHRAALDDRGDDGPDAEDPLDHAERMIDQALARLEAGARPNYGDAYERRLRREILSALDALAPPAPAGRHGLGHNNPPPDEISAPSAPDVSLAADELRRELRRSKPEATVVARAAKVLWAAAKWFGSKIDKATDAFASELGKRGAQAAIGGGMLTALGLSGVVQKLGEWLTTVTLPF